MKGILTLLTVVYGLLVPLVTAEEPASGLVKIERELPPFTNGYALTTTGTIYGATIGTNPQEWDLVKVLGNQVQKLATVQADALQIHPMASDDRILFIHRKSSRRFITQLYLPDPQFHFSIADADIVAANDSGWFIYRHDSRLWLMSDPREFPRQINVQGLRGLYAIHLSPHGRIYTTDKSGFLYECYVGGKQPDQVQTNADENLRLRVLNTNAVGHALVRDHGNFSSSAVVNLEAGSRRPQLLGAADNGSVLMDDGTCLMNLTNLVYWQLVSPSGEAQYLHRVVDLPGATTVYAANRGGWCILTSQDTAYLAQITNVSPQAVSPATTESNPYLQIICPGWKGGLTSKVVSVGRQFFRESTRHDLANQWDSWVVNLGNQVAFNDEAKNDSADAFMSYREQGARDARRIIAEKRQLVMVFMHSAGAGYADALSDALAPAGIPVVLVGFDLHVPSGIAPASIGDKAQFFVHIRNQHLNHLVEPAAETSLHYGFHLGRAGIVMPTAANPEVSSYDSKWVNMSRFKLSKRFSHKHEQPLWYAEKHPELLLTIIREVYSQGKVPTYGIIEKGQDYPLARNK